MTLYFPVIKVRISVAARGFLVPGDVDYFGASPNLPFLCVFLLSPSQVGPLQVGPLNPASLWSAVSSPNGVWSEAPAANDFGAF